MGVAGDHAVSPDVGLSGTNMQVSRGSSVHGASAYAGPCRLVMPC